MKNATELHRTVIVKPDFLDVGIAVVTYAENKETHFQLFYQIETWMGFSDDMRLRSTRNYLQVTIEGLHQTIIAELPDVEAAKKMSEHWHEVGCIFARAAQAQIKTQALLTLAASM